MQTSANQNQNQMETRANALLNAMAKHEYRNAIAHFDSNMTSLLPSNKVEELWTTLQAKAGPFIEKTSTRTVRDEGKPPVVILLCKFAKGSADVLVTFNDKADITGLHVTPAPDQQAKTAANPPEAAAPGAAAPEAAAPE